MLLKRKNFILLSTLFLFSLYAEFDLEIHPFTQEQITQKTPIHSDWTIIFYIAGDNDLAYFARRNIEEMKQVGSNKNVSLVVQLDLQGAHEYTKRLYVAKNILYQMNAHDITSQQKLNSGSAQTLIDCCEWAIENYPANHYALILWNHGIGILDSIRSKTTNASELFSFNPSNHMLELNRSIDFLDFINHKAIKEEQRGICFSDTYGSYLTNQKLDYALKTICEKNLPQKKFDIIAFDACLMSMVEVGSLIRPYTNIMVGSQEVELGTGWPYRLILEPFTQSSLSPQEFAQHIVNSYAKNYTPITKDFTQSAIDLSKLAALEKNIDQVSLLLIEALRYQANYSVKRAVQASRSKRICTHFSEPTYIDLSHFYENLLEAVIFMSVEKEKQQLLSELQNTLNQGIILLQESVLINATGENLKRAKGLSIYFPIRHIDLSYSQTPFAQTTHWINFLKLIL